MNVHAFNVSGRRQKKIIPVNSKEGTRGRAHRKGDFWELQDGRRVRHGDHLPLQKYIRNTSTRGTAPIEHPLNTGRRPQTSQKARNYPRTWVGQKKKEKTETKE